MGLKQIAGKIIGKGKIREGCRFDKNTGRFECESRRVMDDGTEVELGRVSGGLTGDCNVTPDEVYENEDGTIERLEKKFVSKIKGKCRSEPKATPGDY